VRRVAVIASASGNGKTTLGRALAARLDVPFVELDALVHGPNWTETSDEDLRARAEVLDDLRPDANPWRSDVMIEALEGAVQRYQSIVANGGWPMVPSTRRPEDDDQRAPLLRQRLMISGELSRKAASGFGYGYEDLEPAVRRFQHNNGLRATGRLDTSTLQALNVPAQARLAQLRVNLQRLRELTEQRIEDRYVLVNVAAFQLEAVEHHQVDRFYCESFDCF